MNPITKYKWEKRVLIVSAGSPTSVGYKRQEQLLSRGKKGMKERDLIIYKMYKDHWIGPDGTPLNDEEAIAIKRAYNLSADIFSVVLVGKDGSVKMRKDDLVSTREIFALIDSMPMRKQEMKKEKDNDYN